MDSDSLVRVLTPARAANTIDERRALAKTICARVPGGVLALVMQADDVAHAERHAQNVIRIRGRNTPLGGSVCSAEEELERRAMAVAAAFAADACDDGGGGTQEQATACAALDHGFQSMRTSMCQSLPSHCQRSRSNFRGIEPI